MSRSSSAIRIFGAEDDALVSRERGVSAVANAPFMVGSLSTLRAVPLCEIFSLDLGIAPLPCGTFCHRSVTRRSKMPRNKPEGLRALGCHRDSNAPSQAWAGGRRTQGSSLRLNA